MRDYSSISTMFFNIDRLMKEKQKKTNEKGGRKTKAMCLPNEQSTSVQFYIQRQQVGYTEMK